MLGVSIEKIKILENWKEIFSFSLDIRAHTINSFSIDINTYTFYLQIEKLITPNTLFYLT